MTRSRWDAAVWAWDGLEPRLVRTDSGEVGCWWGRVVSTTIRRLLTIAMSVERRFSKTRCRLANKVVRLDSTECVLACPVESIVMVCWSTAPNRTFHFSIFYMNVDNFYEFWFIDNFLVINILVIILFNFDYFVYLFNLYYFVDFLKLY